MTIILLNRIKESSNSKSLDQSKLSSRHDVVVREYNLDQDPYLNEQSQASMIISNIKNDIRQMMGSQTLRWTRHTKPLNNEVVAFANIYDVVSPVDFFIDQINFDIFEDENYGSIYTDYYVDGVVKYQKSHPRKSATIPLVFFSAKHFLSFDADNIYNTILSKKVSHHIAVPLCELTLGREQG